MSENINNTESWEGKTFFEIETYIKETLKPVSVSSNYLTLTSKQNGSTVRIDKNGTNPNKYLNAEIKYSVDNGITWNDYTFNDANGITITLNNGESVKFKGNNNGFSLSGTYYYQFILSGQLEGSGDVTSLLNGEGGDAILSENCFYSLFQGCTALRTAPALPATMVTSYCYYRMFYGCSNLTTAPALPATTLASNCYNGMFYGCSYLTTAPALPATRVAANCYKGMFYECVRLTTVPAELPATVLAANCYQNMFYYCSNLTTAPALPATTVASNCYKQMFYHCTNLTTVPAELPATTLISNCYNSMFMSCSNLTTAPVLPATTLVSNCYQYMFNGCSKLNYIKAMFTTTPSSSYTSNWVNGVAATGTFVKNSAATWTTTGVHGVPSGWTVETASE